MRYFRCKCGKAEAWSSMGVSECTKCDDCGSDLAAGPDGHREPKGHDFSLVNDVMTDEGPKPITYCRYCYRARHEIEKEEGK